LTATPIIWGVLVGVLVTLVSALAPAWRAGRIPPVAAMSAERTFNVEGGAWRLVLPVVITILGVAGLVTGLFARPGETSQWLILAGVGAALLFVGVASLARVIVRPTLAGVSAVLRPIARFISWPFAALTHRPRQTVISNLGRENVARTPRRTSAAAAALMIG